MEQDVTQNSPNFTDVRKQRFRFGDSRHSRNIRLFGWHHQIKVHFTDVRKGNVRFDDVTSILVTSPKTTSPNPF